MSLLLLSAVSALAFSLPVQPQALPADQATYDALVACAATWRVSMVRAVGAEDAEAREATTVQFTAFQTLSRLYGAALSAPDTATDAAIREEAWRKLHQYERLSRTEAGQLLRDQAHEGEEAACTALAGRVASDNAD